MFGMMIDVGQNILCYNIHTPLLDFRIEFTHLELSCCFTIKVFRTSLFPNPLMDLVPIWYNDIIMQYHSK